jgi:hypothetical protein
MTDGRSLGGQLLREGSIVQLSWLPVRALILSRGFGTRSIPVQMTTRTPDWMMVSIY